MSDVFTSVDGHVRPLAPTYKGNGMTHETRISETVVACEREWPPEDGAGFIAWCQTRLDAVPPEFRAKASDDTASSLRPGGA